MLFVISLNIWLVVDAFRNNFDTSSVAIWIITGICGILFLGLLAYISFCKIASKEPHFELIANEITSTEATDNILQEVAITDIGIKNTNNNILE